MSSPDYRLTLRPQPSDVPPVQRLRALLKYALRVQGLRCVSVEEVKPADEASVTPHEPAECPMPDTDHPTIADAKRLAELPKTCPVCGTVFWKEKKRTYIAWANRVVCSRACRGPWLTDPSPDRFWEKVERPESGEGCWQWTGSIQSGGYGSFLWAGKTQKAHRVAWMLVNGAIPDGLHVCHHCDNPRCVRPDHLFLGTAKDNSQDALRKGRCAHQAKPDCFAKGSEHGNAKLAEADIPVIRRLAGSGMTLTAIAKQFGVNVASIHRVMTGETWSHVEG